MSLDARLTGLCEAHGRIPDQLDPIEQALYADAPFGLSNDQALELRFGAIRAAFEYHYHHNPFYRRYCDTSGFRLDDLASPSDLVDVPLVPEHTFKGCPEPEQLVAWLRGMSSDEIPWPQPGVLSGDYDQQLAVLKRDYSVHVRSTSGSSGIPSFLPRDAVTKRRSAHWKIISYFAMYPELLEAGDLASVTLWPLDFSWADLMVPAERVHALMDKELGLPTVIRAMTIPRSRGIVDRLLGRKGNKQGEALLLCLADQLGELASRHRGGILWAPPFILYALSRYVREHDLSLQLGEGWRIELGGGWKLLHEKPLSEQELRQLASEALGVPGGHIHDIFGSTECLGLCGMSCEGGYKHIPHAVLHPLVLDEAMKPVAIGEWGRFAYLNPLIQAYPGFIVTGDRVRMWQQCPACDRPGPVLDAQISRMPGAEDRGCTNIVQELIDERIS